MTIINNLGGGGGGTGFDSIVTIDIASVPNTDNLYVVPAGKVVDRMWFSFVNPTGSGPSPGDVKVSYDGITAAGTPGDIVIYSFPGVGAFNDLMFPVPAQLDDLDSTRIIELNIPEGATINFRTSATWDNVLYTYKVKIGLR